MPPKKIKTPPPILTPLEAARKRLVEALRGAQMSMNGLESMTLEELLVEAAERIEYMSDPYNHYCSCRRCDCDPYDD